MNQIDELSVNIKIINIANKLADIYIAFEENADVDYFYGGTRIVDSQTNFKEINWILTRLMVYESKIKNQLINIALQNNIFSNYYNELPIGFMKSIVGGARCIIKPKNKEIAEIISNPNHPQFKIFIFKIFESIGEKLNEANGKIKLTPDFGRFAELADFLRKFTPHVLGLRCEDGGCGGKSSYTTSGIIAAFEKMQPSISKNTNITLIGSEGSMGYEVLEYFLKKEFQNIAICDLRYDDEMSLHDESTKRVDKLPSKFGKFTDYCLKRGGLIMATTVGQELENSNWHLIPPQSTLFLAHNLAIPSGREGIELMQNIAKCGVIALPGQVLTLGGALTARLEWFWRKSNPNKDFNKVLAHSVVKDMVEFWVEKILSIKNDLNVTPYEAMLYCIRTEI